MTDPLIGSASLDGASGSTAGQEQALPFQVNGACTVTSIRVPQIFSQPLESGKFVGIASAKAASPTWLGKFTGPGPGNSWQTYLLDTPAVLAPATTYWLMNTGIYGASAAADPVLTGVVSSTPKTLYYGPTYTGGPIAFYQYFGLYGTLAGPSGGTGSLPDRLKAWYATAITAPNLALYLPKSLADLEWVWLKQTSGLSNVSRNDMIKNLGLSNRDPFIPTGFTP